MPRLRFLDPRTLDVFPGGGSSPPPDDGSVSCSSASNDDDNLHSVQLAAVQEFYQTHRKNTELLQDYSVLGVSVRELSKTNGVHPGTISRAVRRTQDGLRMHVIAHSISFLIASEERFLFCPHSAKRVSSCTSAVGIRELSMDFDFPPTFSQCLAFLKSVWKPLHASSCNAPESAQLSRYLHGWRSRQRFWLDVSVATVD